MRLKKKIDKKNKTNNNHQIKKNKIQYEEQMEWHILFSWILYIYQKIKLLLTWVYQKNLKKKKHP